MKHLNKLFFFIFLVSLTAACELDNDKIQNSIVIEGTVKNTSGNGLEGVKVELFTLAGSRVTQTDNSGKYRFVDVSAGLGRINLTYYNYYDVTRNFVIGNDDHDFKDFTMRNFQDDYFLTVNPGLISLKNSDTKGAFVVNTNAGFIVETKADWLKVTPSGASFSAAITILCEENNTPDKREAVITITGDYNIISEVTVIQEGGL